jgi:hypothetical protein
MAVRVARCQCLRLDSFPAFTLTTGLIPLANRICRTWPSCCGLKYYKAFQPVACAASIHLSRWHLDMSHTAYVVPNAAKHEKSQSW